MVSSNSNSVASKFKYNGVELEESLGLNLYEMDFRMYDPAIGRFNGIDPVTHFSQGTSVAFDNNPIFWADPSGANSVGADGLTNDQWMEHFRPGGGGHDAGRAQARQNFQNEVAAGKKISVGEGSFEFGENNSPPDWLKELFKKWNKSLNSKERELVMWSNPLKMVSVEENAKKATNMTVQVFGFNGKGDLSDAFRHMLLQALNIQEIGSSYTEKWSDAHEYSTPVNEKSDLYMDIHNNTIGIEIGKSNPNASIEELARIILSKLKSGEGIILNSNSKLVNSNGKNINSNFVKRKNISKKIFSEIKSGSINSSKYKFHYE